MSLGILLLLFAGAGAIWMLFRIARNQDAGEARTMTVLKGVVWLGLAAALFAVKLWPLAFMVLVAAGGVSAIELWRKRAIAEEARAEPAAKAPNKPMEAKEAAALLGVPDGATLSEIRAAHRKLIAQIHPDKGGTDYLAAKINEARDVLMAKATPASD
ncbi:MAG: DnaJ domain-containing protein [Pseudomonadota bacterium]